MHPYFGSSECRVETSFRSLLCLTTLAPLKGYKPAGAAAPIHVLPLLVIINTSAHVSLLLIAKKVRHGVLLGTRETYNATYWWYRVNQYIRTLGGKCWACALA